MPVSRDDLLRSAILTPPFMTLHVLPPLPTHLRVILRGVGTLATFHMGSTIALRVVPVSERRIGQISCLILGYSTIMR
jgi:hypothetical protein